MRDRQRALPHLTGPMNHSRKAARCLTAFPLNESGDICKIELDSELVRLHFRTGHDFIYGCGSFSSLSYSLDGFSKVYHTMGLFKWAYTSSIRLGKLCAVRKADDEHSNVRP